MRCVAGHHVSICSTKTLKARAIGAWTRTLLRTTASATVFSFATLLSFWLLFRCCLKGAQRLGPHPVEVCTQPCHSLGMQLVEAPRSGFAVGDQPGILEHPEVLRHRGTADWQRLSQFVDGNRAARELLKDRHAGSIAQGVETGL